MKSLKILAILSICSLFLTSCLVRKKLLVAAEKERVTCQKNLEHLEDELDNTTAQLFKIEKDFNKMTVLKDSLQVENDTLGRIIIQLRDDSVKIAQQYDSVSVKLDSAASEMFVMGQFIDSLFIYSMKLRDSLNTSRAQIEDLDSLLYSEFTGDESESDVRMPVKRKNVVLNPPSNNSQKIGNTGAKKTAVVKKPVVKKKPALRRKIVKKKK